MKKPPSQNRLAASLKCGPVAAVEGRDDDATGAERGIEVLHYEPQNITLPAPSRHPLQQRLPRSARPGATILTNFHPGN
jgi:hypothetical protein